MATRFKSRTLQELVEPLLEVRELGEVYTSPFCELR